MATTDPHELAHVGDHNPFISALISEKDPSDEELASAHEALGRWIRNEDVTNDMIIFVRTNTGELRAMTIPDPIILSEGHLSRYRLMLSYCSYTPSIPNLRTGIQRRLKSLNDVNKSPEFIHTPLVENAVILCRIPDSPMVGLAYINLMTLLQLGSIMGADYVDQISILASATEQTGR